MYLVAKNSNKKLLIKVQTRATVFMALTLTSLQKAVVSHISIITVIIVNTENLIVYCLRG